MQILMLLSGIILQLTQIIAWLGLILLCYNSLNIANIVFVVAGKAAAAAC